MAQLPWQSQLQQTISDRKAAGLYRRSRLRDGEQGVEVVLDGRKLLSFSSNDYLGLAAHPALKTAFVEALDREGVGSGAAHLLTGHSRYHHQLEQALAEFTGQQRVLLFSTGYMANIGVIDGLLGKTDVVVQDKLNHASLLDGGRLCDAQQLRYPHVDMGLLHQRLHTAANARNKLIVSDGVFSMDGDIAPLPEIMDLAEQHKAGVIIDDAHGFGVLGQNGGGVVEHFALTLQQMPILVGTFGKAFGTAGAFVAADEVVIETLVQQARSFIYTTAQPPAIAAATLASLKLIKQESWRRDKLQQLIQQFRDGAAQLGLPLMPSQTAIQPLLIGDDKTALKLGQDLEQQGILVGIIRPPTVPKNTARLRITLSAAHDVWHIEQLLLGLERSYVH
ncbi:MULTISPECIES: 8-amino-7-oxononanoate synthase [unclassified Methylophaga]|uniref:8-amino-7-oxononanoate synthase n=1 Tax=unclassified Methylophaga TaxID=2629249 RepID=UPI000C8F4B6E|nr:MULTISPECIES: 8-amino-7-oxononanoate synthase [unclassified Methylophaga]MAK67751.1 8-amino-7-oxononanoate synthase [Methylophaga sp.]MAY18432.1 8-amino-7-oxononanoate synthase [Methylophaga sp.]